MPRGHSAETFQSMRIVLELWDELRAREGPFYFTMRGFSMWPAAPEGSLLAVDPSARAHLAPGDLVTFRLGHKVVTHRVFDVTPSGRVATWGDASLRPDGLIAPEDILGRATVVERAALFPRLAIVRVAVERAAAIVARRRRRAGARRARG